MKFLQGRRKFLSLSGNFSLSSLSSTLKLEPHKDLPYNPSILNSLFSNQKFVCNSLVSFSPTFSARQSYILTPDILPVLDGVQILLHDLKL